MASLTVGRHSTCDIVIDDAGVSRHHAELTPTGGGKFLLRDIDSAAGTFVKDGQLWRRVQRATVSLKDVLRLGSSELSVADLVGRLSDPSVAFDGGGGKVEPSDDAPARKSSGRAVRYERDPETGLIVEKR